MKWNPKRYRLRYSIAIFRALIFPQILIFLALRCLHLEAPIIRMTFHILIVPLYGYVLKIRRSAIAKWMGAEEIPRVKGKWPGNIDVLFKMISSADSSYTLQFAADTFDKYGCKTINMGVLWQDQIMTIDENIVKQMLMKPQFGKGYYWSEKGETLLGDGIFNRDGEMWRVHRAIARPYFSKARVSDFGLLETHAKSALDLIAKHAKHNAALDVQDLLGRYTLDAATERFIGQTINSLQQPLPVAGQAGIGSKGSLVDGDFGSFLQSFEECQARFADRARFDKHWPLLELFEDKLKTPSNSIRNMIEPLIEHAFAASSATSHAGNSVKDDGTYLAHLVSCSVDKSVVLNQILCMLIAGRDTTSALLTFALYFLALHPDVLDRLRAEILNVVGNKLQPRYEDMKALVYLTAVLKETLRLFPPIPLNSRTHLQGHGTIRGEGNKQLFIPAESTIIFFPIWIQRRKDFWGSDADEFDPERWLDPERVKKAVENPSVFLPFLAGPRSCLGQHLAINQASYFIVRLLQRFQSLELAKDAQPLGSTPPQSWRKMGGRPAIEQCWPATAITVHAKGGLWMRFNPAT